MRSQITTLVPPTYMAQLTGCYRIDVAPRTVKTYRYDGSLCRRVLRSALPKGHENLQFMELAALVEKFGERIA